ncbi:HesA/MoeB/ThiF family protein [Deinococcus aestuarii]|uniref:HesA/MoeB/ThiF family protein n=1 Tax=Deinococcus aestuarii TaxID=2774531 RepID=UPI001C0AF42A|nr:ThiF family adenylyltransferase [Deinococcus aestuarii]
MTATTRQWYVNPYKFKARHGGRLIIGAPHNNNAVQDEKRFDFLFSERTVTEQHLTVLSDAERTLLFREKVLIDWAPDNTRLVDRQLGFFSLLGEDVFTAQQRLETARVAILGAGGLGSQVAFLLASAGVGTLKLCDFDVIERSNLNRQILYRDHDIGRRKIEVAAQTLQAINPDLRVLTSPEYLRDAGDIRRAVQGYDLVVRAVDQPVGVIFEIDAACRAEGIPHVGGGFLDTLVSAGPYCDASTTPLAQTQAGLRDLKIPEYSKGAVFGPLTFWVASYVAGDVVRALSGVTEPLLRGRIYSLDGVTGKLFVQQV